jgi:2-amino-4-hydroxy-6-hydroxymethyldihydropteridine diphosphokinase
VSEGPVHAFLGLGSNLGDRLANLHEAIHRLERVDGIHLLRASRVYETAPVGPPQPEYLNAVVELETSLEPRPLLDACLGIETAMGRVRGERWGPRVIDIDLLTYGDDEIDEPGLTVPHPRMHERVFVLVPLLELEPDPLLPGGRRLGTLRLVAEALTDARPFAPAPRFPPPAVPHAADGAGP